MKLYDLKKGDKIFCELKDGSTYSIFDHLDGRYSYSTSEKGNPVHFAAIASLTEVEGGYKIEEREELQHES